MVTLNKKESRRFIKKMIETENRPPTKEEIKIAKEISKFHEIFNDSSYVIKNGMITFVGEPVFKIEKLEAILRLGKKLKKGDMMCNMTINVKNGKKKSKHKR